MVWGVEETVLAGLGALFLLGVVLSAHPRLSLSLASRIALALAAGGYLAAAVGSSSMEIVGGPRVVWILPVAPLAAAVIVTRDMMKTGTARRVHAMSRAASDEYQREHVAAATLARAANPNTPATELADMAYTEPAVREAVASNPATPSSVLAWLAATGDDAILDAIASRGSATANGAGR